MKKKMKVCVVIPCYKVKNLVEKVIQKIDLKLVNTIIVVDDCCPENTYSYLKKKKFKKLLLLKNKINLGVGGATIRGFRKAIKLDHDIVFKIDGDNQHNPDDLIKFLNLMRKPGVNFCKGTRFKNFNEKNKIPFLRLIGNIILTYLCRINCKNNEITDVVNGFIGIKSNLLKKLNLNIISNDFFFEEDLLFRVSLIEKKIYELPIKTIYHSKSNLSPLKTVLPFIFKHLRNFLIRLNHEFL